MSGIDRFLDVCESCEGKELDFIFFDLSKWKIGGSIFLKDIPGYLCRECEETLISTGVLEVVDELIGDLKESQYFPALRYQEKILGLGASDRQLMERFLHSWQMIKSDGRDCWEVSGFRRFGEWKEIANL